MLNEIDPRLHNIEAGGDEDTTDIERAARANAIGSTLYDKRWVLSALRSLRDVDEADLECLAEMSADPEVAAYLATEARAGSTILSGLFVQPHTASDLRKAELGLVMLTNMLTVDPADFTACPADFVAGPAAALLLSHDETACPDPRFTPVLAALFQYLTAYVEAEELTRDDSSSDADIQASDGMPMPVESRVDDSGMQAGPVAAGPKTIESSEAVSVVNESSETLLDPGEPSADDQPERIVSRPCGPKPATSRRDMSSEPGRASVVDLALDEPLGQKVCLVIASTLNEELLVKASRFLLALTMTDKPLADVYFTGQAVACINEGIRQSLVLRCDRASFMLLETTANLLEKHPIPLELAECQSVCDTVHAYVTAGLGAGQRQELASLSSCIRICRTLWTSCLHMDSFESVGSSVLLRSDADPEDGPLVEAAISSLKHFVLVHSETLSSNPEYLESRVVAHVVQLISNEAAS